MEQMGILMTYPMYSYLEEELNKRFKLLKLWEASSKPNFLNKNSQLIRALVVNASFGADSELIESLPNLEIISSYSVGVDKIDLEKCKLRGGRFVLAALGLLGRNYGRMFSGKSVGIIGLGRIGSAIATRAEAFDCSISYHSRSQKPNVKRASLVITVDEVHMLIRPELVSALLEGRLGGAGLDVFENEPEVPEQLFKLDHVVVLSHVGSDTVETCKAMADLVIANLEAHFLGKPLLTPVL
ncbi:hypothetical protein Leryth_016446 [Lithospermum erythrorhizon]|nr:hypothetical protein Leryth_016446 [Lithospermum erythrorhizon]